MKANVYVDGFNLYYGALKGTRYKWLDLSSLCQTLLGDRDINRIRYFTSRIVPLDYDKQAPWQTRYLLSGTGNTGQSVTVHIAGSRIRR